MSEPGKVQVAITAPGYTSHVEFPLGADAKEAFCSWFEMQLAYLSRWTPGSTATIRETTPLKIEGVDG